MRYVIIDLQDYHGDIEHDNLGLEEGKLLKPKESLAKFKEIWDEASLSTKCATSYAEDIDQIYIDKDWEEFKETL